MNKLDTLLEKLVELKAQDKFNTLDYSIAQAFMDSFNIDLEENKKLIEAGFILENSKPKQKKFRYKDSNVYLFIASLRHISYISFVFEDSIMAKLDLPSYYKFSENKCKDLRKGIKTLNHISYCDYSNPTEDGINQYSRKNNKAVIIEFDDDNNVFAHTIKSCDRREEIPKLIPMSLFYNLNGEIEQEMLTPAQSEFKELYGIEWLHQLDLNNKDSKYQEAFELVSA